MRRKHVGVIAILFLAAPWILGIAAIVAAH